MTFLPVVERELRRASRRPRAYWGRFAAAAIGFVIITWVWIVSGQTTAQHELGQQIFGTLSTLAFLYALLAGVTLTADSIAEEKRDGTLGLLFLTDLKGYDVVLGKLVATSLHAFYGLIAMFPIMAIPILLGGLTQGDYWRMTLTLLTTLFLSLSLGMLASTISHHDRKAQGAALLFIALLLCAPFVWRARFGNPDSPVLWLSPLHAFGYVHEKAYITNPMAFWNGIWVLAVAGLATLMAGSLLLPRVWQDRPRVEQKGWRGRWASLRRGDPWTARGYRTRLLDINPYLWLASRDRLKPYYFYALIALGFLVWYGFYIRNPRDLADPTLLLLIFFCVHLALKIWVALESIKQIAEDKRTGAVELLVSTPLTPQQIVEGQLLAILRQFGWGLLVLLGMNIIVMLKGVREGEINWILMYSAMLIIFIADLVVLVIVGMWLGLTSRRSTRALGKSIAYILLVPWLIFFAFLTMVHIVGIFADQGGALVGSWFVICSLVNVFYFSWAAGNLAQHFREIVAQRFDSTAR